MRPPRRLPVLVVLVAVLAWVGARPSPSRAQVAEVRLGVAKIVVTSPTLRTGAGVVVRRDAEEVFVVTAAHVVSEADEIAIHFRGDSQAWPAEVIDIEYENLAQGLALLRVRGPVPEQVQHLPMIDVALVGGEQVNTIGHQASTGDWGVLAGIVSGRRGREIVIQAPIKEQASGGPVMLGGSIVGLVQRTDPAGDFGYAVTARAIREYVEGLGVVLPAVESRRIVINGPKPLFAPFKNGEVFRECAACPEMVVVVPEREGFTIGTPENQAQWGRDDDEKPLGPIRFARPYAISRFEVTREQFLASGIPPGAGCHVWNSELWLLDLDRSPDRPGFEQAGDHPVVCVRWEEVKQYLDWFNRQPVLAGAGAYRLPSEAEWEYAARAGTRTARYWGDEPGQACGWANVADRSARATFPDLPLHECSDAFAYTAPVGRFKANPFGLFDMIGNASEWVEDCYAEQYPKAIRDGSAFEMEDCPRRVIRGGSWSYGPADARSANRHRYEPDYANNNLGFRLARSL